MCFKNKYLGDALVKIGCGIFGGGAVVLYSKLELSPLCFFLLTSFIGLVIMGLGYCSGKK